MAIRYNPKYNAEIRRVVHNFNQTRNRANQAGYAKSKLPNPVKVSELKARYKTRSELNKELTRLKNFSRQTLKEQIETKGGASTNVWNINYLKSHTDEAKEHFKERQKLYKKKIKNGFPAEKMKLDSIGANGSAYHSFGYDQRGNMIYYYSTMDTNIYTYDDNNNILSDTYIGMVSVGNCLGYVIIHDGDNEFYKELEKETFK